MIALTDSFYEPSKIHFLLEGPSLYEYQVVHELHDAVIKTLLRMYGGEMFIQFVPIFENKLCIALSISEGDIIKRLEQLHKNGVLTYQRKKDKPQLTFLTARYDAPALPLDIAHLEARKKTDTESVKAIIEYACQKERCRTLVIVHYFGEENTEPCGNCDVCTGLRKTHPEAYYYEKYHKNIKMLLASGGLSMQEVTAFFKEADESRIVQVVREMADLQLLAVGADGVVRLRKP
jgi:ATP-dependent DNA helicase RecQ